MDCAFLIDKPTGLSSHSVVAKFRRAYPGIRFGHAGTLDPDASGVLVVLAGKATRVQDVFLTHDKEYAGEIVLGVATDSDDTSGEVTERDEELLFWNSFDEASLVCALEREFTGELQQIPPQVSAVHVNGKRSYALARAGQQVVLSPRRVVISELSIEVLNRTRLRYRVRCSKGTYVRALARDIGAFLNSVACCDTIRRTASGEISLAECCSLEDALSDSSTAVPLEQLLQTLPRFCITNEQRRDLEAGRQDLLAECKLASRQQYAVAAGEQGQVVALLRYDETRGWRLAYVFTA